MVRLRRIGYNGIYNGPVVGGGGGDYPTLGTKMDKAQRSEIAELKQVIQALEHGTPLPKARRHSTHREPLI